MAQGFYCLIQYCPDFSRAEAANVGVLVFQAEPAVTAVRVVGDVRTAMRRVGTSGSAAALLASVESMARRLDRERFQSVQELERFVRTRGNQLQLTPPRSVRVDAIERDVQALFGELVGSESEPLPGRPTGAAAGGGN